MDDLKNLIIYLKRVKDVFYNMQIVMFKEI